MAKKDTNNDKDKDNLDDELDQLEEAAGGLFSASPETVKKIKKQKQLPKDGSSKD